VAARIKTRLGKISRSESLKRSHCAAFGIPYRSTRNAKYWYKKGMVSIDNGLELIRKVRRDPKDTEARMVLADWWEGHGNPQGQHMQWTDRLSSMLACDPDKEQLLKQCMEHQREIRGWVQERGSDAIGDCIAFTHGYLSKVTAHTEKQWNSLLTYLESDLGLVHTFRYQMKRPGFLPKKLLSSRFPASFAPLTLNLSRNKLEKSGFVSLVGANFLDQVTGLELYRTGMGDVEIQYLSQCPSLCQLQSLALGGDGLGIKGIQTLVHSPFLQHLTSLHFFGEGFGDEEVGWLVNTPFAQNLVALHMTVSLKRGTGFQPLVDSPYLQNLTSLNVCGNRLQVQDICALVQSQAFPNVTELNISQNQGAWKERKSWRNRHFCGKSRH
jgi:uncharacterized protein (TIGR02996 family)